MALEYQNLFTTVQPTTPSYAERADRPRQRQSARADSDRTYTCSVGSAMRSSGRSISAGSASPRSCAVFIAFEIIGLNMMASVNWDPIQFVRRLPWLALEPPPAKYGLSIPPLNEGGWWRIAGFFADALGAAMVVPHVPARQGAWHGHARGLGIRCGDLAVPWCWA